MINPESWQETGTMHPKQAPTIKNHPEPVSCGVFVVARRMVFPDRICCCWPAPVPSTRRWRPSSRSSIHPCCRRFRAWRPIQRPGRSRLGPRNDWDVATERGVTWGRFRPRQRKKPTVDVMYSRRTTLHVLVWNMFLARYIEA